MKFSFKFSNLLGTVYKKGDLTFSPDGNSLISPVGNRITVFDLRNHKSETLPFCTRLNISSLALAPDGTQLIAVDEEGEASLCSLISKTVLHTYHFHGPVHSVSYSPDNKKFAVTKGTEILVFLSPGKSKEFNAFVPYKKFYGAYDDTTCIDWSSDSKAFVVGSKDTNSRVYGAERLENLIVHSLGGHNHPVLGAFFAKNSLDVYSVSELGQLSVWQCDTQLEDLKPRVGGREESSSEEEEEEEESREREKRRKDKQKKLEAERKEGMVRYKRLAKHSYKKDRAVGATYGHVCSVAYHKDTRILVTGFDGGAFHLHEMPDFNMIHSLSISDESISSIALNHTGEWIAFGCSGHGQLLVWEWQSESYILKQQGHFNNMTCLRYSPDGHYIATGGDDGKVKLWNTGSGFCFVTFGDHLGGVTGVEFGKKGNVVISSSLDGTVRAYDLTRYRNFRTLTSPRPCQFSCLCVDVSGEIVCAGGLDVFDIFVWSMQTGKLLEVLSGHESPVSSLSLPRSHSILVSSSWDQTIKLWDVFTNKAAKETINFNADVLCVCYRPDGEELAVCTLSSELSFWNPRTAMQTGTIDARRDLGYSRAETDKITAKKSAQSKSFSRLCYTGDGACLLAGGRSRNVCIYSVRDKILLKTFTISQNFSLDGMEAYLDRRKMTEWGSLALVDDEETGTGNQIRLPGVRAGDMSRRQHKPEVRVSAVQFSPTGRQWSATSTEGLLVYSLDHSLVFDPYQLDEDVTPSSIRDASSRGAHQTALMMAFRLNERPLIQECLEKVPVSDVSYLVESLADVYVVKLLDHLSATLDSTPHLEFFLTWTSRLLSYHGNRLKRQSRKVMGTLNQLQKVLTRKKEDLGKICDHNKYSLEYLISLSSHKRRLSQSEAEDGLDVTNEADDISSDAEMEDSESDELSDVMHVT